MQQTTAKFASRRILWGVFTILFCGSQLVVAQQDPSKSEPQTAQSFVREQETTSDFSRVKSRVSQYLKEYDANEILLVVDVDNTMLAMNQDLGSDQWFNWQDGLLESDPQSSDLVANDFSGLLEVQGLLFALSGMHPPEPELPKMVNELLAQGVQAMVLTSRGPEFRDATERELKKNGYDFSKSAPEIKEKRGLFYPLDPDAPSSHGLSAEVTASLQPRLRPVSYSNGIFLTAGQHKGYMLRTLLARRTVGEGDAKQFKAVVFVDDHQRHAKSMHEAHEGVKLDLSTFRYSREDGNVSNFSNSAKRHVVHDWNRLSEFIDRVLVK